LRWDSASWRNFVLLVVPLLVFANTLRNGYHLDDFYRIVNNPHILNLADPWRFFEDPETSSSLPTIVQYRPLMPLTFALGRSVGGALGLEPLVVDHLGTLCFHLLTVQLAFGWLWRMLQLSGEPADRAVRLAGWATLTYAVHPVIGVPVNYLCSRDLLLMQLFALAALNAWSRYRLAQRDPATARRAPRWAAASVALVFISMLAKQNAVALPLVLLAFELLILRAPVRRLATYRGPVLFAVAVAAFFVWTELVIGFSDADQLSFEREFWEYPATMARAHLSYYLRNALWPFEMRMLPDLAAAGSPFELGTVVGALCIAATLVYAWVRRISHPVLSFCILAYWLMFAVTSSIRPFRYLAMDYRQVPSLLYLCLILAWVLEEARERWGESHLHLIVVAYFSVASISINEHWKDGAALWGQAVRTGTRAQGHVNYGLAIRTSDPQEALRHFAIALEEGENIFARINRGITLLDLGRTTEGLESLNRATRVAPGRSLTWYWLSRGHMRTGSSQLALGPAKEAVRLEVGNARYLAHLVRVELELGSDSDARQRLSNSTLESPDLASLRAQLGLTVHAP
jgi:tetratricopeptide (TPR) repeat protein